MYNFRVNSGTLKTSTIVEEKVSVSYRLRDIVIPRPKLNRMRKSIPIMSTLNCTFAKNSKKRKPLGINILEKSLVFWC